MGRKLTQEEFIQKVKVIHGDLYDYSESIYVNSATPLTVLCKIHGAFSISPNNHTSGKKPSGCPKCSKEFQANQLRATTADFIKKAQAVHGDNYNYERVNYKGAFKPVKIICQKHGSFMQSPTSHLGGSGCRQCANERTSERCIKSIEDFVKQSRELFGDKFDYSQVDYKGSWIPVKIYCPDHGWFEQAPVNHLNSVYGCSKCSLVITNANNIRRKGRNEFIKQARYTHGNKYDYSKVDYKNTKTKVTIICPVHGLFQQAPINHIKGQGCNDCGNLLIANKQRSSVEEFVEKAIKKHGDKYDYSKVVYLTARKAVIIICPKHGEFKQTPGTHLNGGCRKCADEALSGVYSLKVINKDPALAQIQVILYYVKFTSKDESFYKIGITRSSIKARFGGYPLATGYNIEVLAKWNMTLVEAFKIEQNIKKMHGSKYQYTPVNTNRVGSLFAGHTECFSEPLPEEIINRIN